MACHHLCLVAINLHSFFTFRLGAYVKLFKQLDMTANFFFASILLAVLRLYLYLHLNVSSLQFHLALDRRDLLYPFLEATLSELGIVLGHTQPGHILTGNRKPHRTEPSRAEMSVFRFSVSVFKT
jgi:hypothetical protein